VQGLGQDEEPGRARGEAGGGGGLGEGEVAMTLSTETTAVNFSGFHRMNPGDRLFSPINNLLVILSAISHATSLIVDADVHKQLNPTMLVNTRQFDHAFVLPLGRLLEHALANKLPQYIEIGMTANDNDVLKDAKISTTGFETIMTNVVSAIFLMFFDRYIDWLKDVYGASLNWPTPLNFCRIVRNACAHDGTVDFRSSKEAPVAWRGLSFGPNDNGRHIIGTELRAGDILGLMFEANSKLDHMEAPVL
jgi:hypothetical protein